MRIVVTGYHPANPSDIVGGVEAITLRLVEGLAAVGGHDVHVVTTRYELSGPQTRELPGRTVHLLPASPRFGNLTFMQRDRARLRACFRHLRPDVIHAHSTTEFALAALETGIPTVVSVHGIIREEARLARGLRDRFQWTFRSLLERRVLARARDIILVSPYVGGAFGSILARARTHTVETSVSDLFFDVRPRPEPAAPRVLYAGLIIPRKGILELVEAARMIRTTHPTAGFRLAGRAIDAGYERAVRETIARASLGDRVALLGPLSPEALAGELARATLLVLPSFQETAPVVIQEAMAAGVPVVATDVGGSRHLVEDGATGIIVPAGDAGALAAAIGSILDDPGRATLMGTTARAEARRRFDSRAVAERTLAVYREVIAGEAIAR